MTIKTAVAHLADSRDDFFTRRKAIFAEEVARLDWLRAEVEVVEVPSIRSDCDVAAFGQQARQADAVSLLIHIPIWADPILAVKVQQQVGLPVLLLGNNRPDTSSLVGMLGAGGALDQVGCLHTRVFDHPSADALRQVRAFLRASAAVRTLRGQTLGLFGGRSLGIATATADAAQIQRLFGVDIETVDQAEIAERARALPAEEADRHTWWLAEQVGDVTYGDAFTAERFEAQVRSYLATRHLADAYGFDLVGVKCQPEMSDGYVSQCVAHLLMNGCQDADGSKHPTVHACEADIDGALSMQILHLLSDGEPTALVDIRWYNDETGAWTLANCGAISASFFATEQDPTGFSGIHVMPHVFGQGGGGAYAGLVAPGPVTLARLCRRNGSYWMAILAGDVQAVDPAEANRTTAAFPQAIVRTPAGLEFAGLFGSNHIHMVRGDVTEELVQFCRLTGIEHRLWK